MYPIHAKSLLSAENGMNLYRGCTHGCIYCDSRSACYRFERDFTDIGVKENAPELLEQALRRKRRKCMIGTGSMCDPYLPAERELRLTRRCLELIARYDFGAAVLTKSDLILRDLDLLEQINRQQKAVVQMTLTTFDEALCRILEPHVCTTRRRFEVLCEMQKRGIPTVVWLCPLLPYLNDTAENLRGILQYCLDAGVRGIVCFDMGMTLREGSREFYYAALDRHFPGLRARYEREYGDAYVLRSPRAAELDAIFRAFCTQHGILHTPEDCFAYLRELPEAYTQLTLS
ncbi:MAG: radical SAM protein [Oscillospiraceae bacterium]|nr:radical SAM protein [Oscillospiraceae bacterium]